MADTARRPGRPTLLHQRALGIVDDQIRPPDGGVDEAAGVGVGIPVQRVAATQHPATVRRGLVQETGRQRRHLDARHGRRRGLRGNCPRPRRQQHQQERRRQQQTASTMTRAPAGAGTYAAHGPGYHRASGREWRTSRPGRRLSGHAHTRRPHRPIPFLVADRRARRNQRDRDRPSRRERPSARADDHLPVRLRLPGKHRRRRWRRYRRLARQPAGGAGHGHHRHGQHAAARRRGEAADRLYARGDAARSDHSLPDAHGRCPDPSTKKPHP